MKTATVIAHDARSAMRIQRQWMYDFPEYTTMGAVIWPEHLYGREGLFVVQEGWYRAYGWHGAAEAIDRLNYLVATGRAEVEIVREDYGL